MVQLNGKREIVVTVVKRTWLEALKDAVAKNWKKFPGYVFSVVKTIITGVLKMDSPPLALTDGSLKIRVPKLANFDAMTDKLK